MWLVTSSDLRNVTNPDDTDGFAYESSSQKVDWSALGRVVAQVGSEVFGAETVKQVGVPHSPQSVDIVVPHPPSSYETQMVLDWFGSPLLAPRADAGAPITSGRRRLWNMWDAQPDLVLPIYSEVLTRSEDYVQSTLNEREAYSAAARRVLQSASPGTFDRSPHYLDELSYWAQRASL